MERFYRFRKNENRSSGRTGCRQSRRYFQSRMSTKRPAIAAAAAMAGETRWVRPL